MNALRILIVDDDQDFADGLMEVFELEGYSPEMVHMGSEAIKAVRAARFDIAVVDIGLPDINGAECASALKKIQPDLKCFLLTGYSAQDIARKGIDVGRTEILTKPVDPVTLCRRITEN